MISVSWQEPLPVAERSDRPLTGAEFLRAIEDHLALTGIKPTAFGQKCLGDPRFIATIRSGRSPRIDTANRVLAWMRQQRAAA